MPCANSCGDSEILYKGNGSQVQFTFPFEYMAQSDVKVDIYNESTRRWVLATDSSWLGEYEWSFANATTIEFTKAPPAPIEADFNIKIYRCTDIDPLIAQFNPGSAIRARDLNDNFEQLKLAIEEGRCQVPDWLYDYLENEYWDKIDDVITYDEQINDPSAKVDDEHIFTASAIAARHDAYVQDAKPADLPVEQEGKIWNDTDDLQDYFWDPTANAWVSFTKSGPSGPQGDYGPPGKVIVADNPPMMYPAVGDNEARELESGDLWWDSNRVLLYVYYTDTNSSQWVAVSKTGPQGPPGEQGPEGGLSDAPDDGTLYGRQNEQWVEAQEPLTFTAPLQKDNSNDVAFVWSSMNSLP